MNTQLFTLTARILMSQIEMGTRSARGGLMKVFLSWSGDRSKALAQIFDNWLPATIQAIKPYFSPDDVDKGARWSVDVAAELEACQIGLLFVTPDNRHAAWMMFEAGSLAKSVGKSRVIPILFGLEPSELTGPLVQFQAATFNRTEIDRVVRTINRELPDGGLDCGVLASVFEMWWVKLENEVAAEMAKAVPKHTKRDTRDIVEETLAIVRQISRRAVRVNSGRSRVSEPVLHSLVGAWSDLVDDCISSNRLLKK